MIKNLKQRILLLEQENATLRNQLTQSQEWVIYYQSKLNDIALLHDQRSFHGWDDGYAEGLNHAADMASEALASEQPWK